MLIDSCPLQRVPTEDAKYIHRVGRTARMGATGRSVTLHSGAEEYARVKKFAKLCAASVNKETSSATDQKGEKGPKGNTVLKKRTVAEEPVNAAYERIQALETDIAEIVEEEAEERELRLADVQITRAENMDKHKSDDGFYSRGMIIVVPLLPLSPSACRSRTRVRSRPAPREDGFSPTTRRSSGRRWSARSARTK